MNIILLQEQDFINCTQVRIGGARGAHIRCVLRAGVGDQLKVGVLNRQLGTGVITALGSEEVSLTVSLVHDAPPPSPISLILALPRPKMLKRIVHMVAELGIKKLTLLNSYRVEKSYWQSPALSQAQIARYLHLGLAQAGDTIMPQVSMEKRFKPFVEDRLATHLAGRQGFVAHPGSAAAQAPAAPGNMLLAIGPEGGFIPYEVDKLRSGGLELLNLGERTLRVETAVPFAVASLLRGAVRR